MTVFVEDADGLWRECDLPEDKRLDGVAPKRDDYKPINDDVYRLVPYPSLRDSSHPEYKTRLAEYYAAVSGKKTRLVQFGGRLETLKTLVKESPPERQ